MRTEITHTVNVVQKERSFFSSSAHQCVVTKYIIHVSLPSAGSAVPLEWQVARRYSHFRSNHTALSSMFSQLPKLPPKKLSMQASMERLSSSNAGPAPPDPELIASRMVSLDAYLKQLLSIPTISGCTQMRTFLGAYQGMQPSWFEELSRDSLARMTPLADELADGSSSPASPSSAGVWSGGKLAYDGAGGAAANGVGGCCSPRDDSKDDEGCSSPVDPPPVDFFVPGEAGDNSAAQAIIKEMGLLISVDAFAAQFSKLCFAARPDAAAGMVQRFLNGMEAAIAVAHPEGYPDGCTEGALWWARDALEDRLLHRLHDDVFGVLPEERQQDVRRSRASGPRAFRRLWPKALAEGAGRRRWPKALAEGAGRRRWPKALPEGSARRLCPKALPKGSARRLCPKLMPRRGPQPCSRARPHARPRLCLRPQVDLSECLLQLSDVLQPSQLDVGTAFCDTRFNRWAAASAELRQIGIRRTARAKMDCVMQCVLQLKQGLLECLGAVGGHGPLGADELFPVFVFVVLQCNPPRLASTLAYVQRFRSPMALKSEAGCYFTHLQAAVSFLQV